MDNAKEPRTDMQGYVISADLPDFEHYRSMDNNALWNEVQKSYPTGYKLSHAFLCLPATLISRTGKLIAASIANKVNPSHTGVCYASRKTLALDAEVSVATLDRFTSGAAGRAIFTSEIPKDKIGLETARRTLTRGAMLFCLAISLFRKTVSRVKQKVMAFALKAASSVLFTKSGGRKTIPGEGAQNALQNKILPPSKSQKEKINIGTGDTNSVDNSEVPQGKTLTQWDEQINQTRIQGQLNTAERNYQERLSALSANEKRYKHMFIKLMDVFKSSTHQREDVMFRSSYANVDYSKKPKGFR
ncbi:hypothetical protein [Citrobacter sp. NCU1]|uniref:hypothetical protein n=1 Tax=Citrobacter sp. NCU1 TaxID=2026683 RepID=UPI0013918139|nr:hypothetical protein [Citrobacter sp. NCU1]